MAPQYPGRFCARSFLPERLDVSRRSTSTRISKSLPELQKPSVVSKQTEQSIIVGNRTCWGRVLGVDSARLGRRAWGVAAPTAHSRLALFQSWRFSIGDGCNVEEKGDEVGWFENQLDSLGGGEGRKQVQAGALINPRRGIFFVLNNLISRDKL